MKKGMRDANNALQKTCLHNAQVKLDGSRRGDFKARQNLANQNTLLTGMASVANQMK